MKLRSQGAYSERGSLPGLAAVLLVIVVTTIGFTATLNIESPNSRVEQAARFENAVASTPIVGAILQSDGSLQPIIPGDPDFQASIDKLAARYPNERVCVALFRTTMNPLTCNPTTAFLVDDYRLVCTTPDIKCTGVVTGLAVAEGACESRITACLQRVTAAGRQVTAVPVAKKRG